MRNSILIFITLIELLGTSTAQGFDVDGLKHEMKKEAVIAIFSRLNFENVLDKGDQVQFFDLNIKENNRYAIVTFKNNKLVGYAKNLRPSMSNYIKAFKALSEEYGPTVKCESTSETISVGEIEELHCTWISPIDEVSIIYSILPSSDQLSVTYMAR
jgi:hypothetical protein